MQEALRVVRGDSEIDSLKANQGASVDVRDTQKTRLTQVVLPTSAED